MPLSRIRYVSLWAPGLAPGELDNIVATSQLNNGPEGITGILIAQGGIFFQLFEGPTDNVRALVKRLRADNRHRHMVVLREDHGLDNRLFGAWAMRPVRLDPQAELELRRLGTLLRCATDPATLARQLDTAVWEAFSRHPLGPTSTRPSAPHYRGRIA